MKLVGIRAFTFLGASNRIPAIEEINVMGTLEANTCYDGMTHFDNPVPLESFLDVSKEGVDLANEMIKIFKTGNNGDRRIALKDLPDTDRPIMYEKDDDYFYKYMSNEPGGGSGQKWIPMNGNFDGDGYYQEGTDAAFGEVDTRKDSYLEKPNGNLFLPSDSYLSPHIENYGGIFLRIFSEEEYGSATKGLRPDYIHQVDAIKKMVTTLKKVHGDTIYLNSGQLYKNKISGPSGEKNAVQGWNILGDDTSKYAFTTVKYIDIKSSENAVGETGEGDNTYPFPTHSQDAAPLLSIFYVSMVSQFGATSLSRVLKNYEPEFSKTPTEQYGQKWFEIRNGGARKWSNTDQAPEKGSQLGENRQLFNEPNEALYIPHVDFMAVNQQWGNTYTHWSLFGSRLYFEQRRSSSPITARASLFLHTLPWNQYLRIIQILVVFKVVYLKMQKDIQLLTYLIEKRHLFTHLIYGVHG